MKIDVKYSYVPVYKDDRLMHYKLKTENLSGYKIFKVTASYGDKPPSDYFVRGWSEKQAKERFKGAINFLKIIKIEESNLDEKDIDHSKDVII